MDSEKYLITDVPAFVEGSRVLVYSLFGTNTSMDDAVLAMADLTKEEQIEIDSCLSQKESALIAKDFLSKRGNKYMISEKGYAEYLESLTSRLTSNLLSNMVKKGHLETAFDTETNDFIFWSNNDEEEA